MTNMTANKENLLALRHLVDYAIAEAVETRLPRLEKLLRAACEEIDSILDGKKALGKARQESPPAAEPKPRGTPQIRLVVDSNDRYK